MNIHSLGLLNETEPAMPTLDRTFGTEERKRCNYEISKKTPKHSQRTTSLAGIPGDGLCGVALVMEPHHKSRSFRRGA